jgi:hypothetical protein
MNAALLAKCRLVLTALVTSGFNPDVATINSVMRLIEQLQKMENEKPAA